MNKRTVPWYKISVIGSVSVGILLIIMGFYFSVVSIIQVSASKDVLRLKDGLPISNDRLNDLIGKQRFAANFSGEGLLLQDLGLAELTMAKRYGYFSQEGKDFIQSAKLHLQEGLKKSPANSVGWLRLAYIKLLLEGASKDVSNTIYMSVTTAPYNYRVLYYRLNLAILAWNYFSEDEKDALLQQIRIGWRWDKKKIIELVTSDNAKNIIAQALLVSPEDSFEFKKAVGG